MSKDKQYSEKAKIFKALGHPTRIFIMEALNQKGVLCVCEITEMLDYDISTISKHLTILKDAGLVTSTKKGNMVLYDSLIPCLSSFLGCLEFTDKRECSLNPQNFDKTKK